MPALSIPCSRTIDWTLKGTSRERKNIEIVKINNAYMRMG
jgi:hypothetical protein